MSSEKVLENRVRRTADRRGMKIQKSRRRDPLAKDFGRYRVVDSETNAVVGGGGRWGYSFTLGDVAEFLGAVR